MLRASLTKARQTSKQERRDEARSAKADPSLAMAGTATGQRLLWAPSILVMADDGFDAGGINVGCVAKCRQAQTRLVPPRAFGWLNVCCSTQRTHGPDPHA